MTHRPFFSSAKHPGRRPDWSREAGTLFTEEPKTCQFRSILVVPRNSLLFWGKIVSNGRPGDTCGIALYGKPSILVWISSPIRKTGKGRCASRNAIDKRLSLVLVSSQIAEPPLFQESVVGLQQSPGPLLLRDRLSQNRVDGSTP